MELTVEIVKVNPKMALKMLDTNVINRILKAWRVKHFLHIIERGHYALIPDAIIISDKGRLLNGQHRLQALVKSGKTLKFMIIYGLDEKYFPLLDSGSKRSANDALYIEGFNHPNLYAKMARQTIRWEENLFWGKGKKEWMSTPMDILEYVLEHKEELATTVNHVKAQNSGNQWFSEGIFAVSYHIMRQFSTQQPEEIASFWTCMMDGIDPETHVKANAVNWLKKTMTANKKSNSKLQMKVMYACIFQAWNGYALNNWKDISTEEMEETNPV